jgi:hypothetical protein
MTCHDEQTRTAVNDRRSLAKVGVAGSNPVVRSTRTCSDQQLLFGRATPRVGRPMIRPIAVQFRPPIAKWGKSVAIMAMHD